MENALAALSDELAAAVERSGRAVVTVNARPRSASSGVHWRPGVIVTAEHTIRHEEDITIGIPGGGVAPAVLAGRDAGTDLAVLRADKLDIPAAEFSNAEIRPGALALAIGRSSDTGVNATMGVVSAVSGAFRTWRGGMIDRYVRLDVTVYPGSSGGAVVDSQGGLIGIATSGLSRIAPLAIPVSTVNRVVDALLAKGRVTRGYLGVGLQRIDLPEPHGAGLIVLSVEPSGPSGRAGVVLGDILVALDGKPLRDTDDVQSALEPEFVGEPVKASLLRGGKPLDLAITVGERPRRGE
jgi:S1-C subfamily serine protease